MKKILLFLMCLGMAYSATAQDRSADLYTDSWNTQTAFRHMSLGVEIGTMGAGVNIAMPVVTDHLMLVLGYNFPTIKYSTDVDVDVDDVNRDIRDLNQKIAELKDKAALYGESADGLTELRNLNGTISGDGKLNMGNFKAMLEYYPSVRSSFHFTAGVMIGKSNFIDLEARSSVEDWAVYTDLHKNYINANSLIDRINDKAGVHVIDRLKNDPSNISFDFDGTTYRIEDLDNDKRGDMKGSITIQKVKPYFGIGFGNIVPKNRFAVQIEIGAWFHGKPKYEIENKAIGNYVASDDDDDFGEIMDAVKDFSVYPQISIRLNGRIF